MVFSLVWNIKKCHSPWRIFLPLTHISFIISPCPQVIVFTSSQALLSSLTFLFSSSLLIIIVYMTLGTQWWSIFNSTVGQPQGQTVNSILHFIQRLVSWKPWKKGPSSTMATNAYIKKTVFPSCPPEHGLELFLRERPLLFYSNRCGDSFLHLL